MLTVDARVIEPDADTVFLVGPEGLVWTQPAIGDPYIVAARNDAERTNAAQFILGLLEMGLVPYGLPLGQRALVAVFGGPMLRDCEWVHHAEAPAPGGAEAGVLPTRAAVIIP